MAKKIGPAKGESSAMREARAELAEAVTKLCQSADDIGETVRRLRAAARTAHPLAVVDRHRYTAEGWLADVIAYDLKDQLAEAIRCLKRDVRDDVMPELTRAAKDAACGAEQRKAAHALAKEIEGKLEAGEPCADLQVKFRAIADDRPQWVDNPRPFHLSWLRMTRERYFQVRGGGAV